MYARSSLLGLPLEIREQIYEYYFADTVVSIHPPSIVIETWRARTMTAPGGGGSGTPHPDLAILQVCKQIWEEAETAFYRHVMFRVDIMVRRPFVPTEKLYKMRRFCGGAEVRQLLELDINQDPKRKQHCLVGPFQPERICVKELKLTSWISDPILAFMVEEANQDSHRPITLDMYLSVYSPWVF